MGTQGYPPIISASGVASPPGPHTPPQSIFEKNAHVRRKTMPLPLIVAIAIIFAAVVSFLLGYFYRKKVSEKEISSADDDARSILH